MANFVVRNYGPKKAPKGGTIRIYGAGFSASTKAWFGGYEAVIGDYGYDFLDVVCPETADTYALSVGATSSSAVAVGNVTVVADVSTLPIQASERPSVNDIQTAMLGLMPSGFAWFKGLTGNFAKLMLGLGYAVDEIYRLAGSLKTNLSPTHNDSLDDWENELGLPEDGVTYSGTDAQKRIKRLAEIYRKSCKHGSPTIPFIKSIAMLFGIDADVYEYCKNPSQFTGVSDTQANLYYYWMVRDHGSTGTVTIMRCGNVTACGGNARAGMRLKSWGNPNYYKLIEKIKPAHTKCLYAYSEA